MSKFDQIYGKSLQTLVTKTLLYQNNAGIDKLTLVELSNLILSDKPALKKHINSYKDFLKFKRRIFNCVKQLSQSELIDLKKIDADNISVKYYIIYTKIK